MGNAVERVLPPLEIEHDQSPHQSRVVRAILEDVERHSFLGRNQLIFRRLLE